MSKISNMKRAIPTFISSYKIEYIVGENYQYYASTQHSDAAYEIGRMLQAQGNSVRISEIHEGQKELGFLKANILDIKTIKELKGYEDGRQYIQ